MGLFQGAQLLQLKFSIILTEDLGVKEEKQRLLPITFSANAELNLFACMISS